MVDGPVEAWRSAGFGLVGRGQVEAAELDAPLHEPTGRRLRHVRMHAITVRILVEEAAPARGDENDVAGLARRTAAFQIGHRYLLAGLTLHRPAHRWPGKSLQRDGVDRLAVGDEVPESVDVSARVDREVDAGHVQPPLLDLDAALDFDGRKDPLRVHAGPERVSEINQRHAGA